MKLNLDISAISGVIKRFGAVVYIFILLTAGLIAYTSNYGSLSSELLAVGITLLCTLVALEVLRRTLLFIFTNQYFLQRSIPLVVKIFGVIAIVALLTSGAVYYGYEKPSQIAEQKRQDIEAFAEYQTALEKLPAAKAQAATCHSTENRNSSVGSQTVSPYCRQVTLDYNACRDDGLSYTQCIAIDDYVSACSTNSNSFLGNIKFGSTCDKQVQVLENTISFYELTHPNAASSSNQNNN